MGEVCAPGVSLALVGGVGMAAWISGALFGWGLREARAIAAGFAPGNGPKKARGVGARTHGAASRPRRSDYFVSEETRGWGAGRWRRLTGWVLLTAVLASLTGALLVTALNPEPNSQPAMTPQP